MAKEDLIEMMGVVNEVLPDTRFRVTSMANTPQDFRAKLASSPEIILLDATVFDGPPPLTEALTSVSGAVYLIVPGGVGTELIEQFKARPTSVACSIAFLLRTGMAPGRPVQTGQINVFGSGALE